MTLNVPIARGIVTAADATRIAAQAGIDIAQLMTTLLPAAASFAKPPVSNFHVGAVSRGLSGNLYLGTGSTATFSGSANVNGTIIQNPASQTLLNHRSYQSLYRSNSKRYEAKQTFYKSTTSRRSGRY